MDKKTVFIKTSKGIGEAANQSDHLYGDAKRVLLLVDDDSTVAEIAKRAPPSLRASLESVLQDLVDNDFIRDGKEPESAPQKAALKFATPKFASPKAAPPVPEKEPEQEMELDFSFIAAIPPKPASPQPASPQPAPQPSAVNPEVAKAQARAAAEAKAKQEAEAQRIKAAQLAQIEATAAAAKAKAYAEAKAKARTEVEARAKAEAEARIKQEAEAARLKAEREAEQMRAEQEAAKAKAELELRARAIAATRIKQEAEAARLKAEKEAAQARAELEAAKAKMEAEIRARVETEARAKQEAEAARLKAEREAAQARAELEAARVKAEAEARARIESEARVKAEIEARLKLEAEDARLKAEKEEAQARAAKAAAEAEVKARIETESRVKAEVEARLKQEAEETRLKLEREELAARTSMEVARAKLEAEARLKIEAEARIRAEVEARIFQEEEAARLQAAKVLVELDAVKAKAEADAKALVEAAARLKEEAAARLRQEEEEAHIKAEKERADALIDPAEKIRQSFAGAAANGKQDNGAGGFKFESFSLGQSASATIPPRNMAGTPDNAQTTPGGGSKVKAAMEQRAQKEAEAQRLKAEQEAATFKAEQEAAARVAAEKEAARLKAEHEAYKAKVEQEEARAKAAEEARKQADEQNKAWGEAEQRAKAKAQAEKERLERQLAEAQAKPAPKIPKARRKPLPLGKIFAGLVVLAIMAVALLPYVWPLDGYVAPLEQELSAQLHQPVHIGKLTAGLLPTPKLELHDATVGSKAQELKVANVIINFDFSAMFSPTKSINNLLLNKVSLNGQSLAAAMSWLQAAGGNEKYPVAHMELQGVRVSSDEIKVPILSGHADFDAQGHFSKAEMKSEDGKLGIELESVPKHLQLEVNFRDSSLPLLPNIPFTDLSATGEIINGEIVFSELFGHAYGGALGGNARLNWQNGWLLQSRLILKSVELQSLFPQFGISGELYSDINVTLFGAKLAQLADAPRMEGTFEAKKVVVKKVDIETLARFGNRPDLSRGQTSFDEIKGSLQADSQGQHFRQLDISSGILNGSGQMDVANQQLSGKLSVELKGARGGAVTLLLSGAPTEPLVKAR